MYGLVFRISDLFSKKSRLCAPHRGGRNFNSRHLDSFIEKVYYVARSYTRRLTCIMKNSELPCRTERTLETTPRSDTRGVHPPVAEQKLMWRVAYEHLLLLIQSREPGESLPSYADLAAELECSLAPVKHAVRELAAQGWISLQRGRPARVLWTGSFRRSAERTGSSVVTRIFHSAFRPLEPTDAAIGQALGLANGQPCIVCGRVRAIDGKPVAISIAYINPMFFLHPETFFLDHDVVTGSLRDVYASLGVRPIRIPAVLKPALADQQERHLLGTEPCTPVLRVHQQTLVEWHGCAHVLEIMKGTYTSAIDYRVDRLPQWRVLEPSE